MPSLGPLEQVSIKWAGGALDLDVTLDRRGSMIAEIETIRSSKPPVILSHRSPVAHPYPTRRLTRVSPFGPTKKQRKQVIIAIIEGFLGGDAAVIA